MMSKKLVGTALVALLTVGFAGQVLAVTEVNGDGTTNVNGENTGKMKVRGSLGKEDNTDPEAPIEEGSDKWINVTFPTATVFNSDDAKTIASPSYKMKNNSARDVQVDIAQYIIDGGEGVPALEQLNIKTNQGEILLAENGATTVAEKKKAGTIGADKEMDFFFTGLVDKSKLTEEKGNVESHVVFEFKALEKFSK